MENKINIACFKEGSRTAEIKGIWKWDYGQILRIQGLNLPTAVEIHFSLDEHGGEAVRRIGLTKDGVTDVVVPDTMLENESAYGDSYYFFAYIYLTDETSGNTEYKIRAKVSTRSKPEGYVSGGNDTFAEILKTVNKIAEDKVDIPVPAKVGQVIAVSEVGEDGRPTGFEATDQGGGVSDEKIAEAVGTYMEANPIEGTLDETLTDNTKAAPAGMVGEMKKEISSLSEEISKQTGTGLSTEAIDKLEEVGNYLAYTTADGGSKWTELISILRNGSSGGGSGDTDVTLTSISATYTGGEVSAGTALTDLTGITVTASYSDGSTKTITNYTLSGEILEGENTITVSYGGMTTTFTVTGVSSGGEETGVSNETEWTDGVPYTFEWVKNEYVKNSDGTMKAYNGWDRTPHLYCKGATSLTTFNPSITTQYNVFYDENKTFLSKFSVIPGASTVEIPENACYFVISYDTTNIRDNEAPFSITPNA